MFTYIIDLTYYYHCHYYYCYYYYYHYFWRWYRLIWARTCITYSLIWFFFLRFCQHEIKHSNPIQSNIQHSMRMVLNKRFHIWFYIITVYYKMRQFYYKMRQLLQNVTFITNRESINIDWTKPIKFLDKLTEKNYNSQNLIDFVTHKTSKNLTLCLKLVFINLFIEHFVHLEASVHLEEKRLT